MKILHLSDIHLEFGFIEPPTTNADVVVLSGDIHIGTQSIDWAAKFSVPTIIILGNHEAYTSLALDELIHQCRKKAKQHPLVHFLENESVSIDGVRFHGATFWSDFELYDTFELSAHYAINMMNDFRMITYQGETFTPEISAKLHRQSRIWLYDSISKSKDKMNVIVTHHLPTPTAIQPKYRGNELSPAFASNCIEFSKYSNKISLWLYGHNHDCTEFVENGIRYATNQRGYEGHELVEGFNPHKILEI